MNPSFSVPTIPPSAVLVNPHPHPSLPLTATPHPTTCQAVERAARLQDRLRRAGASLHAARAAAAADRLRREQAEAAAAGCRRLVEQLYGARASGQLGEALQVRSDGGLGRRKGS